MTSIIFICIVILLILKHGSKGKAAGARKERNAPIKPDRRMQNFTRHDGVCQAAKVRKTGLDALGLEDRENDWLARQLREEARLKRKLYSDMAALKEEHLAEHGRLHGR